MKARIEFHVDGSIGQAEEEIVEVIVNPTDNLFDSYKRGSIDGLAFLCVKEDKFLFGVMPTYALASGYYGLRLIDLLDNNGSGFPKSVEVPPKVCMICSKPLGKMNKSGYCQTHTEHNPARRKENLINIGNDLN